MKSFVPTFIWYAATVDPPPLPVSDELAATAEVISKLFELTILVIWYSLFKTAAVIEPPRLAAPVNVTKSFS